VSPEPTDVAVIGLGGRFPKAADVDAFWANLLTGVDGIHDYTDDELAELGVPSSLRDRDDLVRAGGALADWDAFDADHFGIDPAAAVRMDPQHRIFLETAAVALQDAAHDPDRYPGMIGVFASCGPNRYHLTELLPHLQHAEQSWESLLPSGTGPDHMVAQVAYRLGLTGPAMAISATCAGSLVSVCTAVQHLADYRCDIALAGGVHVTTPRHVRQADGLLSADGRCRAFAAGADGAGMSSGAAVLALKRWEDAEADGDRVYAVIRGHAVNNDGRGRAGYATPGVLGQQAVVTEALAAAQIDPSEIGLIQAHAMGTPIGDAIEVAALAAVWEAAGATDIGRCALGAVKCNIGNLDVASGAAALIAGVLAVHHGLIPGNLTVASNPQVDFAHSPFAVPTDTGPWRAGDTERIAGVSSFGVGGTNAHVVVQGVPATTGMPVAESRPADRAAGTDTGRHQLLISARTAAELHRMANRLADHLDAHPELRLVDVAHTLAVGRRRYPTSAVVTATDLRQAADRLRSTDLLLDSSSTTATPQVTSAGQGANTAVGHGNPLHASEHTIEEVIDTAGDRAADRAARDSVVDGATDARNNGGRRISLPSYPFTRSRFRIGPVSADLPTSGQP